MSAAQRFPRDVVEALDRAKIIGIRAGTGPHRFIGVWPVVVEGRLFVRSWGIKPGGWYHAFREEPRGAIQVGGRELPVRAVFTRSERLKDAVSRAYREKYDTPGALRYVRDFARPRRRDTTTELVPPRPAARSRRVSGARPAPSRTRRASPSRSRRRP